MSYICVRKVKEIFVVFDIEIKLIQKTSEILKEIIFSCISYHHVKIQYHLNSKQNLMFLNSASYTPTSNHNVVVVRQSLTIN